MVSSVVSHERSASIGEQTPPTRRDRLAIPALVFAAAVSSIGNNLSAIAIPWFVYVTTGSATQTGIVAMAGLLPVAIGGLFGGAFVDRLGFKQSSVISDIASGLTVAIVPTLYVLDILEFWHLPVLAALGALLDAPGWTARSAMIPGLARRVSMPLERANSAIQLSQTGGQVVGPAIAGTLIGFIGAANVLYVNAGTFAISALVIGFMTVNPRRTAQDETLTAEAPGSIISDAMAGLRYIARDALIRTLLTIAMALNFLFAPMFAVIMPVYVKTYFDSPSALGFLAAAFGVGSVVGTLAFGAFGDRVSRNLVFGGGSILLSAGIWVLPLSTTLAISIAGGLIAGLALGPINIVASVILQERVPEEMLGRVIGALSLTMLASPLGVLLAGLSIDAIGVRPTLMGIAMGVTLIMVVVFVHPSVRSIDRLPDAPPS